jgi:hypothetical protein
LEITITQKTKHFFEANTTTAEGQWASPSEGDTIDQQENKSEPCNSKGLFSLANTPINLQNLEKELQYISDNEKDFILKGFRYGFSLCYYGPKFPFMAKNLKSAISHPEVVVEKISKEVKEGRVAGPFRLPPIPNLRISPLGLVPKKGANDFRLIHHLSYPPSASVNDYIDPKLCHVKYTQFDEAIKLVQDLGQGCLFM